MGSDAERFERVLASGVLAQGLVPGAVAVGGTAAALYAEHRLSFDTDHLLGDLRGRFEEVLTHLQEAEGWTTARVRPPVLILGRLEDEEVGLRQMRRLAPLQTVPYATRHGMLTIPTWEEMLAMKAVLTTRRRAVRDFLDVAALAALRPFDAPAALADRLPLYRASEGDVIETEVVQSLLAGEADDRDGAELRSYRGVRAPWDDWSRVVEGCRKLGEGYAALLLGGVA